MLSDNSIYHYKTRQERFLAAVESLRLDFPIAEISKKTGYGMSTISQYVNKKVNVSLNFLQIFCLHYEFNYEEMKNGADAKQANEKKEIIEVGRHAATNGNPDWQGLPMYNAPITASFVESYRDDNIYSPAFYLSDPRFRDCTFGAVITGDSMHSEIRHGDYVVCKEVTDKRFVVFGDIYYVVATNGLETCKYINADPKSDDNLLLVPRNEKLSPSPIPKDMIMKLFKVRGIVRGY